MDTKQTFNRNKELAQWWRSVVTHQNFEQVQMFARSAFLDLEPTAEQLKGAKMLETIQLSLVEPDNTGQELPSPGLFHQIEALPTQPVHEKTKKKKK